METYERINTPYLLINYKLSGANNKTFDILFFSLQGRCNREKPPCKYFHPPQHLKDQLLINGRNHLALKNALMQQMGMAPNGQPIITSQLQPMVSIPFCFAFPFHRSQCVCVILLHDNSTKPRKYAHMTSIKMHC